VGKGAKRRAHLARKVRSKKALLPSSTPYVSAK